MLEYKEAYEPSLGSLSSKEKPPLPYLEAVVIFNLAVYVCHTYLDIRQLRVSQPHDALQGIHKQTLTQHLLTAFLPI